MAQPFREGRGRQAPLRRSSALQIPIQSASVRWSSVCRFCCGWRYQFLKHLTVLSLPHLAGEESRGSLPRSLSHGSRARSGPCRRNDYGIGNIAPERLSTPRQEKRIVLSPCRQEAWLVRPEVVLERRVECGVTVVVAEQIQLNLIGSGAGK